VTAGVSARQRDAAWVLRMGRHGVQVLAVVLMLALVFTMVNVQQFAAQGHPLFGVQWWIAWLLDPMASVTMAAAIIFEGLLADYGKPKVHWLTATKWYAGIATWGMNIWSSAAAGSFAGIWLHSVAPGILLGLAEAAPRVRRHMAEIIAELDSVSPAAPAAPVEVPAAAPVFPRVTASTWSAPKTPAWVSGSPAVPPVVPASTRSPVAPAVPQRSPRVSSTAVDGSGSRPVNEPVSERVVEPVMPLPQLPTEVPVGVLEVRGQADTHLVETEQPRDAEVTLAGNGDGPAAAGNDEILTLLREWIRESAAEGGDVTKRQIMSRFGVTDHRARTLKRLATADLVGAVSSNGKAPGSDVSRAGA
jgi:hypothetical protein